MGIFYSQWGDYDRQQYLDGTVTYPVLSHFQQGTAVTIGNTVAETTIFTTGLGSRTFQGGWFRVGSIVRVHILGTIKTLDAAETLRFRAYLGGTVILDSTALTYPSIASATGFRRDLDFTFSAIGASGSCGAGATELIYSAAPASVGTSTVPTVSTVDTTAAQTLNMTYTWGAANAANVLIVYGVEVECMG